MPFLRSVAVMGALGHELWIYREALMAMLHPLVGSHTLSSHTGSTPSTRCQAFFQGNTDKHKTADFMKVRVARRLVAHRHGMQLDGYGPLLGAQLLLAALEAELVEQYMAEEHPLLPPVAERSAQNMRQVWWTLHPEDNTLKLVLDLVLAAMHTELFDWGLRHNAIRAVEAARSGVLLDIMCGRGHLNYALLTMVALADWGPGVNGRCSDAARKLFVDNCSSGAQGKGQPVDLNTEECIRELKSVGACVRLTLRPTSAQVHKPSRVRRLRRAHVQQG
jgi:hypothetical protein